MHRGVARLEAAVNVNTTISPSLARQEVGSLPTIETRSSVGHAEYPRESSPPHRAVPPGKEFPEAMLEMGRAAEVSALQPWKAVFPMLVTESPILTNVSEVQSLKASRPMLVTESGMVTEASEPQYWTAACPRLVTESGMVTEVSELQPLKA
jgi:hypothetical protein